MNAVLADDLYGWMEAYGYEELTDEFVAWLNAVDTIDRIVIWEWLTEHGMSDDLAEETSWNAWEILTERTDQ